MNKLTEMSTNPTNTAIALYSGEFDEKELSTFEKHFRPKDCLQVEWDIFIDTCYTYRLSPMRKQMYLVGRWDNSKKRIAYNPQISIGGLRGLALRTNEFEGTTEPEWGDEEGNWHTLWPKHLGKHPYAARIGVYRRGFRSPKWGVAYFHELEQKKKDGTRTDFWENKGIHQIIKCAEADALRGAFEEQCGGVYIHEEMNQADTDSPVVTIIPEVEATETNEALAETAKNMSTKAPEPARSRLALTLDELKTLCDEVMGVGKWRTVVVKTLGEEVGDIPDELLSSTHLTQIHEALLVRKKNKAKLAQNSVVQTTKTA